MKEIYAEGLSVGYNKISVCDNISFSIESGDYVCVVGENGAGKTTLLKTLLGLIPSVSGKIGFSEKLKQYGIGYLPQRNELQKDFPATCEEIILSGRLRRGKLNLFYGRADKQAAADNAEKLGVTPFYKKSFAELSGGQQQRVLLARALCATENLIVMDEPVSGLDPETTKELYSVITELNQSGVTVIMITHDVKIALKYCNKVLFIGHGGNNFFGTADEYLDFDSGIKAEAKND